MEVGVKNTIKTVSFAGMVATIAFAVFSIVNLEGKPAAQVTGDFRNAGVAEIRDAQGQTLLRGSFVAVEGDDAGEVERQAKLEAADTSSKATGEAEVEYQTDKPNEQEIEFKAEGIAAGIEVTFVIDGTTISNAKADAKGKVEVEFAAKVQ
jgi:hypothetical protein